VPALTCLPPLPGKLLKAAGILAILWLALTINAHTSPVVVLHYAADATQPVVFFFDEPAAHVIRDTIYPGTSLSFRTPRDPYPGYVASVSLPLASRDGVEIEPPFSRVDVYIGADTKIARTVIRTDYLARLGFD
jgi:hypothetical protein